MELHGKVAFITGASRGIGRSTALALAREGARVALIARDVAALKEVAAEIRQSGSACRAIPTDLRREEDIGAAIQMAVDSFGGLDIVVNNAGLGYFSPIAELSTALWDEMFAVNVRGLFLTTRQALPHLRQRGESVIVNVASLAGKNAFIGGGGYAASKHAVLGFSRCLMLEERTNGVRVLAICPGSVATDFSSGRHRGDKEREQRILAAEDVAACIVQMIKLPQRAMLSEIDLRPSNP